MKNFKYILTFLVFLFSCQQKPDSEQIKHFAQTLHDYTHFEFKAVQQQFVDKLTEDMQRLLQNKDAIIDTKELKELLPKAKEANRESYEHIKNTTEVGAEINLRQKALDINRLLDSLYNNQFHRTIEILESNDTNKAESISKLIDGKLRERVMQVQNTSKEASAEFSNKYHITFAKDPRK